MCSCLYWKSDWHWQWCQKYPGKWWISGQVLRLWNICGHAKRHANSSVGVRFGMIIDGGKSFLASFRINWHVGPLQCRSTNALILERDVWAVFCAGCAPTSNINRPTWLIRGAYRCWMFFLSGNSIPSSQRTSSTLQEWWAILVDVSYYRKVAC